MYEGKGSFCMKHKGLALASLGGRDCSNGVWIRCNKRNAWWREGECRVDFPSLIVAEHGHNPVWAIYKYPIEYNYILDFIIATYGDMHSIRLMLCWLNSLRSDGCFMLKHFVKCFFSNVSPSLSKPPLCTINIVTLWKAQ